MERAKLHTIEVRRQQEQARLDSLKGAGERNKQGQFATPPDLALCLARYVHKLISSAPVRFLDPAVGTGSFYSALSQVFSPERIEAAVGVELDPLFAEAADALWGGLGLKVVEGDFTRELPPRQRFNLVLANPPYVRHHHLRATEKNRLKSLLANSLYLEMSGLAGLYCYFLLLCHDWMEDGGVAVWLIPSEFMDVNYGATLRRYFTERVTLLHIHRFCPTDVQFADALVSSSVVVFRKSLPPPDHTVRFSFAGPIEHPETEIMVPLDALGRSHKWTQFPGQAAVENSHELSLGDIFTIKRGLATGGNSFFILSEADIKTWQIPLLFLKHILPGPRYLTEDIVQAQPDGAPIVSPMLYLLDCREPEEKIRTNWPRFYEYLQQGREKKIHTAYLASHRAPWYSQEQRPAAPFLCTYMGRSRNGKHPFRFIWNRSQATAHNVYLMLYPRGRFGHALKENPNLELHVFEALKRITPAQFFSEGRVYGGGLHKVEPNELAKVSARLVLDSIESHVHIERQMPMFA